MVTERSMHQHRNQLGLAISKLFTRDPDLGDSVSVRDSDGRRVIVAAIWSDTVHWVIEQVRQAGGVALVVVVRKPEGESVARLAMARIAMHETEDPAGCDLPVGPDCAMEDLLKVLMIGSSITITLSDAEAVFDGASETDAPAELIDT